MAELNEKLEVTEDKELLNREVQIAKKFPFYFENFEIPQWAREQDLEVYRACRTGKVERLSFLNSYEENDFAIRSIGREDDPQEYSLSTYTKYRDVKRFMTLTSEFGIPFVIAKGITRSIHGLVLETKEWKMKLGIKYKGSHVDWWLYEEAQPWQEFEEVSNEYRKVI